MTLATPGELLSARVSTRALSALPAFNVIGLEHVEAFVGMAEQLNVPLILQLSQNAVGYRGGLRPFAVAILEQAKSASVDIGVQLDHAEDMGLIRDAVDAGFTSVMFDGSRLEFSENVAQTRAVVAELSQRGVWVEAELGEIGGKRGAHATGVRTDPQEALQFVAETGIDGLAVSVGSMHAMKSQETVLDLDLIAELYRSVPVPLVLHGASGVSDDLVAEACRAGISKVNFGTRFNIAFTHALRTALAEYDGVDPRVYLGVARDALDSDARHTLSLFA